MSSFGLIEIVLFLVVGPVLYIGSLIWTYRDAQRRNVSPVLPVVLVAVAAWPLGLIIWLFIRSSR